MNLFVYNVDDPEIHTKLIYVLDNYSLIPLSALFGCACICLNPHVLKLIGVKLN